MEELTCSEFKGMLLSLYEDLKVFNKLSDMMAGCGVMKPFDWDMSTSQLLDIYERVEDIYLRLSVCSDQEAGSDAIRIAVEYTGELMESVHQLATVSHKLSEKASGKKYGYFAHVKNVREWKRREKVRIKLGKQLNVAYHMNW